MSILDYIERIKRENEGPRITAQEPRTLLAEYKPGDAEIEMERTEVLRPKRIDILGNVIPAETLEDYDTRFVRPNAEGGRIGYKNAKLVKQAQQAGNVAKMKARYDRLSQIIQDARRTGDYTALKTKPGYKRPDTGGKLYSYETEEINKALEGTVKERNALAKKLGIKTSELVDAVEKSKAKISTEKSIKMKEMRFTPEVEFQQKLYKEISDNPGTIKQMAKRLGVTEKYLVKHSSDLLKNVYTQNVAIHKTPKFDIDARGKKTLKSWLPNDFKSTDKFLDNFANIDGLKRVQTDNIGLLIKDAYGYGKNPKKYAQSMKVMADYNKFRLKVEKLGMKIEWDHPLSKAFLKGSGVSPDKLLYMTPVDRNFNRGFKMQMGKKYNEALNLTDPILKKEAIKKIRTLADKVGVNIGDVTGKKLTYGTGHLLEKKNLVKEYMTNVKEQNLVAQNLKELKQTKEGRKIIKDVFETGKVQVKTINLEAKKWHQVINASKAQTMAKALESLGIDISNWCSSQRAESGGRIGFARKCGAAFAAENPDGFMKAAKTSGLAEDAFKSGKMIKALKGTKSWALSNLGPAGWIGGELLIMGLGTVWDMSQGKGWKEALDNWTGLGGHFGQAEKRLKQIGIEQGYSEEQINDAMKIGQLMDVSTEWEGKQLKLDQLLEAQDIGGTARVKYRKEPGTYKPVQGQYQDPKRLRDLKTEVPKLWKEGTELYESLKDYGSSVGLYDELQQKKKREEYDEMMRLRSKPMMPGYGQQFQVSGDPQFSPWIYEGAEGGRAGYMGGGITGIRRPHAIPPERQGLRSIMINGKKS